MTGIFEFETGMDKNSHGKKVGQWSQQCIIWINPSWIYTHAACVFGPCGVPHSPKMHPAAPVELNIFQLASMGLLQHVFLPHHKSNGNDLLMPQ